MLYCVIEQEFLEAGKLPIIDHKNLSGGHDKAVKVKTLELEEMLIQRSTLRALQQQQQD